MITVTVSGKTGVGKSTIAMFLAQKLAEEGFKDIDLKLLDEMKPAWFVQNEQRLDHLVGDFIDIKIIEKQA